MSQVPSHFYFNLPECKWVLSQSWYKMVKGKSDCFAAEICMYQQNTRLK